MTWYTGDPTYDSLLTAALALATSILLGAHLLNGPYGRFASSRLGFNLDPRLGWFLMELPATVCFATFYFAGPRRFEPVPLCFLAIWCLHYGNRGFFFPLAMRSPPGAKANFSVSILISGGIVTALHGYLNGAYFSRFGEHYSRAWLTDPRFIAGVSIYLVSIALNIHSDAIVRNLRTKQELAAGDRVYRVPHGGLFRWVSSPAYLAEICAWIGFAIACWSLAAVFILVVSIGNLVPRALATHRWYRERFADYPPDRKALMPFVL